MWTNSQTVFKESSTQILSWTEKARRAGYMREALEEPAIILKKLVNVYFTQEYADAIASPQRCSNILYKLVQDHYDEMKEITYFLVISLMNLFYQGYSSHNMIFTQSAFTTIDKFYHLLPNPITFHSSESYILMKGIFKWVKWDDIHQKGLRAPFSNTIILLCNDHNCLSLLISFFNEFIEQPLSFSACYHQETLKHAAMIVEENLANSDDDIRRFISEISRDKYSQMNSPKSYDTYLISTKPSSNFHFWIVIFIAITLIILLYFLFFSSNKFLKLK